MSNGGGGWPPADADGFGQGGRYGGGEEFGQDHDQARYFDESGYEWSEPSSRSQSQGDPYTPGRTDPYGQSAGRHSGRQPAGSSYGDSYGQDAYGQESHGDSHGQGWQFGGQYAGDQPGRDGYDQGGYGQGSYGQAGFGSYAEPGYGRDPGSDRYARGSYGQDGYGGEYYGRDQYGRDGYGSTASYQAPGGYQQTDGYQQTHGYQQNDGYGQDNGYFSQPSDTGSYGRPDTGSFGRPDTGSFGRPDTGSFGRPDTGSFGRPDTGSFGRPDTGSFGAGDGYLSGAQPDPFGPPGASLRRSELSGPTGQWHDAADDADGWDSDEAAEADRGWQEDADRGLLSRRFSGGDGGGRGPGRRSGRARRPKRLRGKAAFTAAILAGALVLGAVADFGYERFQAWHTARYGDYTGAGSGKVRFLVPSGAALSSLGPALMKAGVIKELRPFDSAAAAATNASHLQPGIYLLHRHMSAALAVQWLLSSAHFINDQVTIIEGTRASAIAQALAKQTGLPVNQFTEIIDHPPASLGLPSWAAGTTAEGFLFPDTYRLLPKMTALQILQMMVTEFKQKVAGINLAGAAQKVGTSPWHALIVASMIQAEAGSVTDFGKISRVVWNRLNDNMPLEFDSTVFFAMGKYGTHVNARQRNFPSPYNTYLHTGLPPGPIGNPGVLAMQAAVHAPHGQWLYFLTDTKHKPYHTYFYNTLAEFQAAQQKYGV